MSRAPESVRIEAVGQPSEEEARFEAWRSAKLYAETEQFAQVMDLRLISDGWRLDDGDWTRVYQFEAIAS